MKNRKKLVALIMVLALAFTTLVGGTLAYFIDDDEATNTFTVGNVSIELIEEFDEENAELMPGKVNAVNKDVWVENDGNNPAWVRLKVYIPSHLDQLTTPQYTDDGYLVAAAFNTMHMNTLPGVEEAWNIEKANKEAVAVTEGEFAGYNEYIFYYNWIVEPGATTAQLLDQVYLDSKLNNEVYFVDNTNEIDYVDYYMGNEVVFTAEFTDGEFEGFDLPLDIIVRAEAIQSETFATMEEAWAAFEVQAPVPAPAA